MYENTEVPNNRNPVTAYKVYCTKRPRESCENNSPFSLSINYVSSEKLTLPETKWFKIQPMGINKLSTIMKECAKKAGLTDDKRFTNHSARKTLVQKLQDHGVPPNQIIQVTGHRNLMSVNNYSSMRDGQQEAISSILSSNSTGSASSTQLQPKQSDSLASSALTAPIKTPNGDDMQALALFQGNVISGGTFNVHVATATETNTVKKYRRIQVIESSDSSQEI